MTTQYLLLGISDTGEPAVVRHFHVLDRRGGLSAGYAVTTDLSRGTTFSAAVVDAIRRTVSRDTRIALTAVPPDEAAEWIRTAVRDWRPRRR